jgi:outer membrane receptor protein involved in Fe transport
MTYRVAKSSNRAGRLLASVASLCVAAAATPVLAQDGAAAEEAEVILVTGSRIARDGSEAPTPVTVIGADLLESRGSTNVGDTLNELPAFRPFVTPATQQAVGGNVGARVLDLRGLGGERTLVLLDGKRFVPSTQRGTVDINLIPTALISRTEIVTGGASAAYGSDAVAGVVNFILNREFEGIRATGQYGLSDQNDNEEWFASLAWGSQFADGRGHFIVAGEYSNNAGMGDCYSRDWCPLEMGISGGGAGNPFTVRGGPAQTGLLNNDGLVTGTPLRGTTFNSDGTLRQYQYGTVFANGATGFLNLGGEDGLENSLLIGTLLIPPVERYSLYSRASYDLSDSVTASLDVSYGRVNGLVRGSPPRANFTIARDNAFLPAGLATLMDANTLTTVAIGRGFTDIGNPVDETQNETWRAVAALEGDIDSNWSWDAYYQYGRNDFRQDYSNNFVAARAQLAVDAVQTANGPKCRVNADSNLTNDVAACVPFNVFGSGNGSPAATSYIATTGFQSALTTEHVLAANVQGSLFDLPGGPLAMALGGEYRDDSMTGAADALSTANQFWSFNGKAIQGSIAVTELYAEAAAPLLADMAGIELLEVNGAVRHTWYDRSNALTGDTSVDVTTWKLGAIYEPADWLRLRVTRSRDIRAPNLTELFGPVSSGRVGVNDPRFPNLAPPQIISFTGANANLRPEVADSWTVGGVLTPDVGFARRLSLSVDYFDIAIQDAIATLGAQTIINRCESGATEFCSLIRRDTSGALIDVQNVLLNVNAQDARGIDIEFNLGLDTGADSALDLRVLATRYLELSTTDTAGVTDRAGQTGYRPGTTTGMPDWTVNTNITWEMGAVTAGLHGSYISGGIYDVLLVGPEDAGYAVTRSNSVNTNRVDNSFLVDLSLAYELRDGLEVFTVIDNLFDTNPPPAASAQGGTNQVFFDPIGRYYKIGARIRLP